MLFNAVPLLILAALYLAVGVAIAPSLWRERRRVGEVGFAAATVFPCLGLTAAILGIAILVEGDGLAGNPLLTLPAILVGAIPLVGVLRSWDQRNRLVAGVLSVGEIEERSLLRDGEAAGVDRFSHRLLDAPDPADVATLLMDEFAEVFDLELANLALLEEEGRVAVLVAAREGGADHEALLGQRVPLDREPSGINAAVREGTAFTIYDADHSAVVNQRLNSIARIKSCVYVPVRVRDRVIGVVFGAVRTPRVFDEDELGRMQTFVGEAGPALERSRVTIALADSLDRERLLSQVSLELRSRRDIDQVLPAVLGEIGRALGAIRCFVKLGDPDETSAVAAEWDADGVLPLGDDVRLPAAHVAARTRRTVAVADVLDAPELGDVRDLTDRGVRSVLATPIVIQDRLLGVLALHRALVGSWNPTELALAEAVAREIAIALGNAEAHEQSSRQTQVERGFYRIAAVLSEPLSEQETLDAVAQAAADALGGDSAAVLRSAGGRLELAGSHELAEGLAAHLRESASALTLCARGGKVLASRRLGEDDRFGDGLGVAAAAAGRGSLLAVPLQQPGGKGSGLVLVFFQGERAFDDEQLELAAQVAAAARGALERSDLYERERRARFLAQRLARAGRDLARELDPDNVLDQAARSAVELLDAAGASVRVLEGDEVVVRAAAGAGQEDALDTRAPSTAWLVGDIVQTRATRAIAEVGADPRVLEADAMLAAGYGAYLGVPMIGPEESAHGILAVYSLKPREWREEEAEALHALAATAATARVNAELYQGVSHEQQRGEAILANVADGIVAVDRDGRVVLWNPAAERVTGVTQAEALGQTPTDALGRPLDAAGGGSHGGSRLLPIRRGGEEVWLSLSEAVMTDPAGAVAGRIYAFRDISSERSVEQMKSDFVSTVSHELRTPLTSIYGFAETLLRQDVLFGDEERATFLRYIASESERLTSIVDRLLSVAQLDTGVMAVQLGETDVRAVVNEAVRTAEGADGQNGHRFVIELDEASLAAEADREKLGQVLAHLLDNAVRYSPAGGTVTVAARRREDAVEVSVEDEGVGIPHAEQERIFRKFYRGDAAAAGAVGAGAAGLGLFLAEGLVTAMGGRIRVDSSEGKGSTFVLELRPAESET